MESSSLNGSTYSFVSPDSRRFTPVSKKKSLLEENNDLNDKKERRKSRVSHGNSRKSVPKTAVSSEKLKEIYSTCIKLSTENKITKQNAFGLELIDYMQEVLTDMREENGTNFQVASVTLDASAKIYGHRVDNVHLETFRMIGSLGQTNCNPEIADNLDAENIPPQSNFPKKLKLPTKQSQSKIETNLRNISLEKKVTSASDNLWNAVFARRPISNYLAQNGPDSYIFYNHCLSSELNTIVIDPLEHHLHEEPHSELPPTSIPTNIISSFDFSENRILDILNDFSFDDWKVPENITTLPSSILPLVINSGCSELPKFEIDDDFDAELLQIPEFDLDVSQNHDNNLSEGSCLVHDIDPIVPNQIIPLPVLTQPTEYSYFNTIQTQTVNALPVPQDSFFPDALNFLQKIRSKNPYAIKKPRTRCKVESQSEDIVLEINKEDKKRLNKSGRKLRNNQTASKSRCNQSVSIDRINDFDINVLFKLFLIPECALRLEALEKLTQTKNTVLEDPNQISNGDFCDDNFDNQAIPEQAINLNYSLLPQPIIPDRIFVKYARIAKRIDTKAVKSSMWNLINNPKSVQNESFVNVHQKLVSVLPKKISSELSPQLSFVCLLHLANEKRLVLSNNGNLSIDIVKN